MPGDASWTLMDLSSGDDLSTSHRFPTKAQAEAAADVMNGVEPDALPESGGTSSVP